MLATILARIDLAMFFAAGFSFAGAVIAVVNIMRTNLYWQQERLGKVLGAYLTAFVVFVVLAWVFWQ